MSQEVRLNQSRINNLNDTNITISVPFSNGGTLFKNVTNTADAIIEDIKAFVFTNKNERAMRPNFGLGLKQYLFENIDKNIKNQILFDIKNEFEKRFPYVNLKDVQIITHEDDYHIHVNAFKIIIAIEIKFANEFVVKTFEKIIK